MCGSGEQQFACHIESCTGTFGSPQARGAHFGQAHSESDRRDCFSRALHDLVDECGHVPTRADMREHGEFSSDPYEKHFGSWSDALRAHGYETNHENDISASRLKGELNRIAQSVDGTPREMDMILHGEFSHEAYIAQFGSWNDAVEAVGYEPNHVFGVDTGELNYGPRWAEQRSVVLERDDHECSVTGQSDGRVYSTEPHVHHITPAREFGAHDPDVETNYDEMNHPSNLISLSPRCHARFEGRWTDCAPKEFALRAQAELYLEDYRDTYGKYPYYD